MQNQKIKICSFNLENFFIYMDMYSGEDLSKITEDEWKNLALKQLQFKQKPLYKIKLVAEMIEDAKPDILILSEVGGRESLENFNYYFLNDSYYIGHIQGNSPRFIDVAFLIKKDLPLEHEVRSNKSKKIIIEQYNKTVESKFSRDVLELLLYFPNDLEPKLIVLATHLKSQISNDYDPKGEYTRSAEFTALLGIFQELKAKHTCPLIIGGDFNFVMKDSDKQILNNYSIVELHDHLNSTEYERMTHVYFDNQESPKHSQLDYILFSHDLVRSVSKEESGTYRFKDFYGNPLDFPTGIKEKRAQCSDHYPLILTILV
jgi:endonuclease/exonuclease/phosphatase family metal-dependent hydrolase